MERRCHVMLSMTLTVSLLVACAGTGELGDDEREPEIGAAAQALVNASNRPLWANRDRLLDLYAQRLQQWGRITSADRCQAWGYMNLVKRWVFLSITHNLSLAPVYRRPDVYRGHNQCIPSPPIPPTAGVPPGTDDCSGGCLISNTTGRGPDCLPTGPQECIAHGACSYSQGERTDSLNQSLLDHVDGVWAVLDGGDPFGTGSCGGINNNRVFFSLDETGIDAVRNNETFGQMNEGGVVWKASGDIAGPHDPFNDSLDTTRGKPRPQMHHWNNDSDAIYLVGRHADVRDVNDPRVIEIDIDYTTFHDSNPVCGRSFWNYREVWASGGWPAIEDQYAPSGCGGLTLSAVQDAATWSTDVTTRGGYVALWGNFGSGHTVHFVQPPRGANMGAFADTAVAPVYESANQINAPVPNNLAPEKGTVWIYLTDSAGRRSESVPIDVR